MARSNNRAIASGEVSDRLMHAVAGLRQELATVAAAVNDFGAPRMQDIQHSLQRGASGLADGLQRQLPVVARRVSRQAGVASRAVVNDPLPALVVMGTLALLTSLVLHRGR